MTNNDLLLLDTLIKASQEQGTHTVSDSDAFASFAFRHLLKEYRISDDELEGGYVDGPNDGGIDGVYVFIDHTLIVENKDIPVEGDENDSLRPDVLIKLLIIQTSRTVSFSESSIDKVRDSTERLLAPAGQKSLLTTLYREEVVDAFLLFHKAVATLARRYPNIEIAFAYMTRGDTTTINAKVLQKAKDLREHFSKFSTGTTGLVTFYGASELHQLARQQLGHTLQLPYRATAEVGDGYVAFVTLRDFRRFLTANDGTLRRHMFDWNVRDYIKHSAVNRAITDTLGDDTAPEFWWLNNGVTMTCSQIFSQAGTFTMSDVQIVNGLQTSYAIVQALRDSGDDARILNDHLLVRILKTTKRSTLDRIIQATNRQNNVAPALLRATDKFQRAIEVFFESQGMYYDRRKYYYVNRNKPRQLIVDIKLLAQAVMAVGLSRPDQARARPSDLLLNDEDYNRIFNQQTALPVFYWIATIHKEVEAFLTPRVDRSERNNLRFHLGMLAAARLVGTTVRNPKQLNDVVDANRRAEDADLAECLVVLQREMATLVSEDETPGKISKSKRFVRAVLSAEGFQTTDLLT